MRTVEDYLTPRALEYYSGDYVLVRPTDRPRLKRYSINQHRHWYGPREVAVCYAYSAKAAAKIFNSYADQDDRAHC